MSDKKLLENEDLLKVTGGVGQGGKHIYSKGQYVEYTYRDTLFCVHISKLVATQAEAYIVNQASKTGNNKPKYDNNIPFNGGPKGVEKTVYDTCPSWCPDLR